MVATHDADAHHSDFQRTVRTNPDSLSHDSKGSPSTVSPAPPSMARADWRPNPDGTQTRFASKTYDGTPDRNCCPDQFTGNIYARNAAAAAEGPHVPQGP